MANYGTYCPLSTLRTTFKYGASETGDDTRLLAVLEAVSRFIDDHCDRHFYVQTATRTLTAQHSDKLLLPYDLLSVTTLKTDEDDDWDYDYTWTTDDYHLYPFNEFPKWKILTKSLGDYSFTSQEEGVQLAGLWGYGNGESATPYESAGVTATGNTTTGTTITTSAGTNLAIGQTWLVDSEQMYVTAGSGTSWTVKRGVNGTTAATHDTATINVYLYPKGVSEACLRLAEKLFRAQDSPFGVVGTADGTSAFIGRFVDVIIAALLNPYRRVTVA